MYICVFVVLKKKFYIILNEKCDGQKTIDIPPGRVSIIREEWCGKRMGKGHVGESKGGRYGSRVITLEILQDL